jgi:hypothetical protein
MKRPASSSVANWPLMVVGLTSYEEMMRGNVTAIVAALSAK